MFMLPCLFSGKDCRKNIICNFCSKVKKKIINFIEKKNYKKELTCSMSNKNVPMSLGL